MAKITLKHLKLMLADLDALDEEINAINKVATMVADTETLIDLKISIVDNDAKKKAEQENMFDEHGFLIDQKTVTSIQDHARGFFQRHYFPSPEEVDLTKGQNGKELKRSIKVKANEKIAFGLLAIILAEKHKQRKAIVDKLKEHGIPIN